MFTGLVEAIGEVTGIRNRAGVREIQIRSPFPVADLRKGASISIHGVCLTLIEAGAVDGTFRAETARETLRRTTLSGLRIGDLVHLERALSAGDRLGGHLVQGHVDGIGKIHRVARFRGEWAIDVLVPRDLVPYVVEKGSIAIDGVSLTVGRVARGRFRVHLIPATVAATLLAQYHPGRGVNLEVDVIAKYVEARLKHEAAGRTGPAGATKVEEEIG